MKHLTTYFSLACYVAMAVLASSIDAKGQDPALNLEPLKSCFAAQKKVRSISADFIQNRSFRTLKSPVTIKGRFWFEMPGKFRWELGDPPKTIILGSRDGATILKIPQKRAEKVAFDSKKTMGATEFLKMMDLNSHQSVEDFCKHMNILSLKPIGNAYRLEMLPKDPAIAKYLTAIRLDFLAESGQWIGFEFLTKDGSSMRTDFSNVRINAKLNSSVFEYDLSGFKIDDET